jgi:hypothetical protein
MKYSDKQKIRLFSTGGLKYGSIRSFSLVLLCSLGLILASCGGDSSTGPNGGNGGNGDNGNEPPPEPTFSNVADIFNSSCGGSGCHIDERTNGVRLDSYTNVTESEGTQYGELVVQPDDADGSPLVDKIEPSPEHGERMPVGGPYLSDDEISLIREWIDEGAQNN